MAISLEGFHLGQHQKDPRLNLITFSTNDSQIILNVKDMKFFTDWGIIELVPVKNVKQRVINVSIDSDVWAWYATAQIILFRDEKIIFSDNFQSGTRGPLGNPIRFRSYTLPETYQAFLEMEGEE